MNGPSENDDCRWHGAMPTDLPVAVPLERPSDRHAMRPVRAVSAKAAELLPPVGLIRSSEMPPPVAEPVAAEARWSGPPVSTGNGERVQVAGDRPNVDANSVQASTPGVHRARRSGSAAARSSAILTAAMVLTAMGVGAMAILPAVSRRGDRHEASAADQERTPPRVDAPDEGFADGTPHLDVPDRPSDSVPSDELEQRPVAGLGELDGNEQLDNELAEVMQLLRKREVMAAERKIEALAGRGWPRTADARRIERYGALVDAIRQLLDDVQAGIDQSGAGRTIRWMGREAPIVRKTDETVTILVDRRNVRLRRDALSDEAVQAFAEGVLDGEDPRNMIRLGAFLLVAGSDNLAEVERLWTEAAERGEDVASFLPFLDAQSW